MALAIVENTCLSRIRWSVLCLTLTRIAVAGFPELPSPAEFIWPLSSFYSVSYSKMYLVRAVSKIEMVVIFEFYYQTNGLAWGHTLLQAVKISQGRIEYSSTLFFLNLCTRWGWVVNTTPRPPLPRERPGTHCTGGWVFSEPLWIGAENLAPHRDSIPGPSSP